MKTLDTFLTIFFLPKKKKVFKKCPVFLQLNAVSTTFNMFNYQVYSINVVPLFLKNFFATSFEPRLS